MQKSKKEKCISSAQIDRHINELLAELRLEDGTIRSYENVELLFRRRLGTQHLAFSKNRGHLQCVYEQMTRELAAADAQGLEDLVCLQPTHELASAFDEMITKVFFDERVSSVAYGDDSEVYIGSINLRLYAFLLLWLSATSKRRVGDELTGLSVCGSSSLGKTRAIDVLISQVSKTIALDAGGIGRYELEPQHTTIFYNDVDIRSILGRRSELKTFKNACRSELSNIKVHSKTKALPPVFTIITTNDCFHKHIFEGRTFPATKVTHRGISKDEMREHARAAKLRVVELRVHRRAKLTPSAVHAIQTPHSCRLGLYSAVLKQLAALSTPPKPVSPFLLPMTFAALRKFTHDFANNGQVYKPPNEYLALLLAKIDRVEARVCPSATPQRQAPGNENHEVRLIGKSLLEEPVAAASDTSSLSSISPCPNGPLAHICL
jgi:hypothetical protein